MAVIVSCLLLVISLVCYPIQSDDLFMYLAIAEDFFKTGSFPATDPFLFTLINSKWIIMHQWLGYLTYYGLYQIGGFDLIIVAKTFLVATCLLLPLILLRKSPGIAIWALSVILGIYAMSFRLMERTSLFSDFLIAGLLLILLLESQRPSKLKYLLPLGFLFWVNLHPIFPIGWFLCVLFLLCQFHLRHTRAFKQMVLLTLACVFITLFNPQGIAGILYPFRFATREGQIFRKYYFEWMPTFSSIYLPQAHTFFIVGLILFNIVLLWLSRKSKCYFQIFSSLFFVSYGVYAIRFVPTMCFSLVLLNTSLSLKLKTKFDQWFKQESSKLTTFKFNTFNFNTFKFSSAISIVLIILCLGLSIKNIFFGYDTISGPRHFGLGLDKNVIPKQAAATILQYPQIGNVFNSHMFGNYLAWAWAGKRKVFYHGFVTDTDFFLQDYAGFSRSLLDFHKLIGKYQIRGFLLDRFQGNERVIEFLSKDPAWALAFQDESSLIFLPR